MTQRRSYRNNPYSSLMHPIREKLLFIISKGIETVPEMSKELNENRMNLYHHLKILENDGLIHSSIGSDRKKHFKLVERGSAKREKQIQKIVLIHGEHTEILEELSGFLASKGIKISDDEIITQVLINLEFKSSH